LANSSIKFSIYYESVILGLDQGQINIDASNEAKLLADFNYIADTYFENPNYLRIDDKPVIFLYLSGIYSGDFKGVFSRIRSALSERNIEVFLVGDEVGWSEQTGEHMEFLDAVSPYITLPRKIQEGEYPGNGDFFADLSVQIGEWEKTANPLGLLVIPDAIPGFSNRHGSLPGFAVPRQTEKDNEGTSMLEEYIKVILPFVEPEHKMIMITSWNEWHEDTQVEPTVVTVSTDQDISPSGSLYTWNYTYEGYGIKNLEVIRSLLASELPHVDSTLNNRPSVRRPMPLRIYPNPVQDFVTIETEKSGPYFMEFFSLNGKILLSEQIEGPFHEIDISGFPQGAYFISVTSKDLVAKERIIKL